MGIEYEGLSRDLLIVRLQELMLETADAEAFFQELADLSARELSAAEKEVSASITLTRHKKAVTAAFSDTLARDMDELQYSLGDGPCLSAMRDGAVVHVPDVGTEGRWPGYTSSVGGRGIGSLLAVPLDLEGGVTGALNLYCHRTNGFTGPGIERAEEFAAGASDVVRLALRVARLDKAKAGMLAAMDSRTTIDLAAGIIMAQNPCSVDAAMTVLRHASAARHVNLRDVAAQIVESINTAEPRIEGVGR